MEIAKEVLDRLDERYVKISDCTTNQAETDKRIDSIHEDVAVLKTRMNTIIAILSAIAAPIVAIAVKYLFGA